MKPAWSIKTAIRLPLIGLSAAWLLFMIASYLQLLSQRITYLKDGTSVYPDPRFQLEIYLFFLGITAFAILTLAGQKLALRIRTESDSGLAISAHRLNNLGVVLSLVAGAIFAIASFSGAWDSYNPSDEPVGLRLLNVYLPIILATALVVFVILAAFVFRKDAPDIPAGEKDEDRKKLQRAIGLAYASPIIGTAIAIIFGLVVYDVTRTNLDVWIWVIIQAVIAVSIIAGTRFAAQSRSSKPLPVKERRIGLAAVKLNLVLAIVFGAVVTLMAFTMGFQAISNLEIWPDWQENMTTMEQQVEITAPSIDWFIQDMLPALVLLALASFGIYRTTISRHADKD
jgi:purine-cytosine permease-like protein